MWAKKKKRNKPRKIIKSVKSNEGKVEAERRRMRSKKMKEEK